MSDTDDITIRLRREIMSLIADEAADTIEQLRKERDEARRMYCEVASDFEHYRRTEIPDNGSPEDYARNEGWDCFKEEGK